LALDPGDLLERHEGSLIELADPLNALGVADATGPGSLGLGLGDRDTFVGEFSQAPTLNRGLGGGGLEQNSRP
jgi:hypothetical protein